MSKLSDSQIRQAAEKEKKKRADETMKKINQILKENNCTILPKGYFEGTNLNLQITIVAN